MQEFARNQSARQAHKAILSTIKTMEKAKQHAVLWYAEIKKRRLYRELGYPTMGLYAKQALGFSETRASDFSRLADRLEQLPKLRGALEEGEIGYTKANQVASVSNKENEAAWLAEAQRSSRRELGQKIKRAKRKAASATKGQAELLPIPQEKQPAAVGPVRQSVEFTPEQFARYEALLEKIARNGAALPGDRAEMLLELLASYLENVGRENEPEKAEQNRTETSKNFRRRKSGEAEAADQTMSTSPPFQIHLHQCPGCRSTTVQTSRGELTVSPATAQRAACDARTSHPGKRNTAAIPPRTRRLVLSRDRHRCRRPDCTNTRFLEIHHRVPRELGGSNDAENLITLCAGCHQLLHEHKWKFDALVRENRPTYKAGPVKENICRRQD
jgi:5-methylcytosine-specific restriction endonuclease McrA